MTIRILAPVALLLLALLLPASALASGEEVLEDWREDASIDGEYSVAELREARRLAEGPELEYYNLPDELAAAIARATGQPVPEARTNVRPGTPDIHARRSREAATDSPLPLLLSLLAFAVVIGGIVAWRMRGNEGDEGDEGDVTVTDDRDASESETSGKPDEASGPHDSGRDE